MKKQRKDKIIQGIRKGVSVGIKTSRTSNETYESLKETKKSLIETGVSLDRASKNGSIFNKGLMVLSGILTYTILKQ